MLVNCPRCGFSQPQDKYCAQCGIDMENFKAPKDSSSRKFFANPIFQIGFVLVIAILVVINLYRKDNSSIQEHFSSLKAKVQISRHVNSPQPLPTDDSIEMKNTAAPENEPAKVEVAMPQGATAQNAGGTASENTGPHNLARPNGHTLHVYYTEMNVQGRNLMFEESRNSGQFNTFNDHTAGIVMNASKKLSGTNRDITIHHKEDKKIEFGRPLQWFLGIKIPELDSEIGLGTYIEITDADANTVKGNIEVTRSWREINEAGTGGIQKRSYPAMFELVKDAAFFVSGILPRRSYLDNDSDLTNIGPFKILNSNKFVRNQTDFIMFVEIDRN